jgi:hypothetical protein
LAYPSFAYMENNKMQKRMARMNKKRRFFLCYCLITLAMAAALLVAARQSTAFAEWYASRLYQLLPHTLGRLFSPLPFSIFELVIVTLIAGIIILTIHSLLMMVHSLISRLAQLYRRFNRRGSADQNLGRDSESADVQCAPLHKKQDLGRDLSWDLLPYLIAVICSLLLMYTLSCGINYSRAPLAQSLGLKPRPSSVQELRMLFTLLCAEASEAAEGILTDTDGYAAPTDSPRAQGQAAMRKLGSTYALFNTYYPKPKPVFFSIGMSRLHIAGIYSPFTIEANYNRNMPPSEIPFSICHELAHLGGFAREDEANFISYLACRESGISDFHYSGLLNALSYVLNALHGEMNLEEYRELLQELPIQVRRDLQRNAAYWQSFAGPAVEISRTVNDAYLKVNNQSDGVKSYGRMVDLLLAYYIISY